MKITSRLGVLLAKIAGRESSLEHMVPPWATNAEEELMLEIADRVDGLESASVPEVETEDKGKYLRANETTGELEWAEAGGGGGGGGGSDLPPVTSADLGKSLMVGRGTGTTSVVAPEQTITIEEQYAVIPNATLTNWVVGATAIVTLDGSTYTGSILDYGTEVAVEFDEGYLGVLDGSLTLASAPGTHTVAVSVINYAFNWGADYPYFQITTEGTIFDQTWQDISDAILVHHKIPFVVLSNGPGSPSGISPVTAVYYSADLNKFCVDCVGSFDGSISLATYKCATPADYPQATIT